MTDTQDPTFNELATTTVTEVECDVKLERLVITDDDGIEHDFHRAVVTDADGIETEHRGPNAGEVLLEAKTQLVQIAAGKIGDQLDGLG